MDFWMSCGTLQTDGFLYELGAFQQVDFLRLLGTLSESGFLTWQLTRFHNTDF
jgi:hypothetical protein